MTLVIQESNLSKRLVVSFKTEQGNSDFVNIFKALTGASSCVGTCCERSAIPAQFHIRRAIVRGQSPGGMRDSRETQWNLKI